MAGFLNTIQLETTSTSGTLTSEQLTTLQESKTNYIVYGTELFKLVDNNTSGDTLIYTCSTNDSGTLKVKSITVTISTLAWTYSELSSGGNKKYLHVITMHKSYTARLGFTLISTDESAYTNISQVATAFNNIAQNSTNFGNYPCAGFDDNYNLFISVCGNASGSGLQVEVMSAIGTAPTEISISSGYSIYDKVTEL